MARTESSSMRRLRAFALRLADVEEGIACRGTALESRTIKTGGKAFLFLRAVDARFRLDASTKEALAYQAKDPSRIVVGKGGWIHVKFDDSTDPLDVLERWIAESHARYASNPKKAKTASRKTATAPRPTKKRKS